MIKFDNPVLTDIVAENPISNNLRISRVKLDILKIAVIIVCFFVIATVGFIMYDASKPYCFLTIDINPSIKLILDNNNHVLSSKAINADGIKILESIQIKGIAVDTAVQKIVLQSIAKGYIYVDKKDCVILLGSYQKNSDISNNILQGIKNTIQKDLEQSGILVEIQTVILTDKVVKEADRKGISAGKLQILELSTSKNIKITRNSILSMTTSSGLLKSNTTKNSIISIKTTSPATTDPASTAPASIHPPVPNETPISGTSSVKADTPQYYIPTPTKAPYTQQESNTISEPIAEKTVEFHPTKIPLSTPVPTLPVQTTKASENIVTPVPSENTDTRYDQDGTQKTQDKTRTNDPSPKDSTINPPDKIEDHSRNNALRDYLRDKISDLAEKYLPDDKIPRKK